MPSEPAIADSSALYALFDRHDAHHQRTVEFVSGMQYEMFTTMAVVTEAAYLLRSDVDVVVSFLRWIRAGAVAVVDLVEDDFDCIIAVITKYADLPADFADATLVAIADRLGIREVATYDSDFRIYRYRRRQRFRLLLLDD